MPDREIEALCNEQRRQVLLPINQAAILKLRQAGVAVARDIQPVFQLMEWGITSDKRKRFQDLANELYILQSLADQAAALAYLFTNAPGGLRSATLTILKRSPGSAARMLLDLFDIRMKADLTK